MSGKTWKKTVLIITLLLLIIVFSGWYFYPVIMWKYMQSDDDSDTMGQYYQIKPSVIDWVTEPPGHWKEINIAAEVPGWKRFKPAQEWLDKWKTSERNATADVRLAFNEFLKNQSTIPVNSPERREELFAKFIIWWNKQAKTSQ